MMKASPGWMFVLAAFLLLVSGEDVAAAEDEGSILDVLDGPSAASLARARLVAPGTARLVPVTQDEGEEEVATGDAWGWEDLGGLTREKIGGRGGGSGIELEGRGRAAPGESERTGVERFGEEPRTLYEESPRGLPAKRTRIGLEFGAFLPFGEKEDSFSTGIVGGAFFGFGLPDLIEGVTLSDELRVLGGQTRSEEQDSGHDVSAILLLFRNDILFHFFPQKSDFNLCFFFGASVGYESVSADREGDFDSDSALWFAVQGGFGVWVGLGGPVDLVLKIEIDLIPVTDNVPVFALGEAGIQVRF